MAMSPSLRSSRTLHRIMPLFPHRIPSDRRATRLLGLSQRTDSFGPVQVTGLEALSPQAVAEELASAWPRFASAEGKSGGAVLYAVARGTRAG